MAGYRKALGQLGQALTVGTTGLPYPVFRRALQKVDGAVFHQQQFAQQAAAQGPGRLALG